MKKLIKSLKISALICALITFCQQIPALTPPPDKGPPKQGYVILDDMAGCKGCKIPCGDPASWNTGFWNAIIPIDPVTGGTAYKDYANPLPVSGTDYYLITIQPKGVQDCNDGQDHGAGSSGDLPEYKFKVIISGNTVAIGVNPADYMYYNYDPITGILYCGYNGNVQVVFDQTGWTFNFACPYGEYGIVDIAHCHSDEPSEFPEGGGDGGDSRINIDNISPNPCSDYFDYVVLSEEDCVLDITLVRIIDGVEYKVQNHLKIIAGENNFSFDCGELESGVYLLQLRKDGAIEDQKPVVKK